MLQWQPFWPAAALHKPKLDPSYWGKLALQVPYHARLTVRGTLGLSRPSRRVAAGLGGWLKVSCICLQTASSASAHPGLRFVCDGRMMPATDSCLEPVFEWFVRSARGC